jgi:hypothetical protein
MIIAELPGHHMDDIETNDCTVDINLLLVAFYCHYIPSAADRPSTYLGLATGDTFVIFLSKAEFRMRMVQGLNAQKPGPGRVPLLGMNGMPGPAN